MSDLTFQDVLNILQFIDSGPFSDFQIEFEGTKLKVTRRTGAARAGAKPRAEPVRAVARPEPTTSPAAPPTPVRGGSPQLDPKQASTSNSPARLLDETANQVDVKPPMAGTFYRTPSPGAAPFVEMGSAVQKGGQLGIVEVMKLFTAVLSPCDGTVRAILVGNEEFVLSDQTLMIIEATE